MIDVRNVGFGYDDGPLVIDGVDLRIEEDETLALMGPNGAGKTTLLKCIAGLYDPDVGSIERVEDTVVGFAPEDPDDALFAATVESEVAFFPLNRGLDVADRVEAALAQMGITHLRERVPQTLSAGEKRLVSLAAVLSGDPTVVALDEPTSGLDVGHVATLGDAVRSLDRTVVVATHDADFALEYADRVAFVVDGTVAVVREAEAVLGDPDFDFEAVGIGVPGSVQFARQQGWDDVPSTPEAAAARIDAAEMND
ncbi:MAG: energy-coupling factor ABC transporter ATP-binding protein [Halanaeroarchaeum sp.]